MPNKLKSKLICPRRVSKYFQIFFERFRKYGLVINTSKYQLGLPEVKFLGHLIINNSIKPLTEKVEAIIKIELPMTVKALRRFLDTINIYGKFIKDIVDTVEILSLPNEMLEGPRVLKVLRCKGPKVQWISSSYLGS